ncbi:hypothetical protein NC652_000608 [Populus alba x Populus x berolinensis]|nr:hypothetical protein NC652_000608 [Populus alba x Populus x berolinensis]
MRAVLVRWRLVCGMGLEKRKVMASGQEISWEDLFRVCGNNSGDG